MRTFVTTIAAIAVVFSSGAAAGAQDSAVETVLGGAARALSASHLKDIPSLHITAKGKALGLPATFESYVALGAGGTIATATRLAMFTSDSGYDGRSAWARDQARRGVG